MGPLRSVKPPIELESLPLDVVLISHTHYDHLDITAIHSIGNRALWIVPLGVKEFLANEGVTNCIELNWWEKYEFKNEITNEIFEITFTPTKHWTSRTPFDKNTCLWGSYLVKSPNNKKFFFTGDTAYCEIFKLIGEKYGPIDLAAIPIGAFKPRWFMKNVHCNPKESILIHNDIKALQSVAIHWGTFPLADEDVIEPALELSYQRSISNPIIDKHSFFTMLPGETHLLNENNENNETSKSIASNEIFNDINDINPQLVEAYYQYKINNTDNNNQEDE